MTDTKMIREQMDVLASCGTRIGKVDHLDGDRIKLNRNDPMADGKHHWVPLDWVESVDRQVHLSKNSEEAMEEWEEEETAVRA